MHNYTRDLKLNIVETSNRIFRRPQIPQSVFVIFLWKRFKVVGTVQLRSKMFTLQMETNDGCVKTKSIHKRFPRVITEATTPFMATRTCLYCVDDEAKSAQGSRSSRVVFRGSWRYCLKAKQVSSAKLTFNKIIHNMYTISTTKLHLKASDITVFSASSSKLLNIYTGASTCNELKSKGWANSLMNSEEEPKHDPSQGVENPRDHDNAAHPANPFRDRSTPINYVKIHEESEMPCYCM